MCTVTKENFKCANCSGSHAAWSLECPNLRGAVDSKKTPTFAQVASASVTPEYLQQVLQEVKESVVMLLTEAYARCVCELTYDIQERNVSKLGLPLKVGKIAANVSNAANKLPFGPASAPIDHNDVKERVMTKCFPKPAPVDLPNTQPGGSSSATS